MKIKELIKELRIGNLLRDKVSNTELKVIELTGENIVTYVIDRSKFPLQKGWGLEPIPLTEEWAVKFGFLKRWNAPAMIINYGELQSVFTLNIVNGEFYFTYGDLKVEYVHQLQNLYFALTNEELIIK